MEKHFVTYDQALDLKDLGFKESCFGEWRQWDGGLPWLQLYQDLDGYSTDDSDYQYTTEAEAPLKSQALSFLRDKYSLHHVIHQFDFKKDTDEEYLAEVNLTDDGFSYFRTYEEAEFFCIDKLIEIVKNKKS